MNKGLRETMSPQSISIGADEETNMKQTHLISIYFSIFIDPKSKILTNQNKTYQVSQVSKQK